MEKYPRPNTLYFSPVVILLLFNCCSTNGNECRKLIISHVLKGKVLANHTIRKIQPIRDDEACMTECYFEPLCLTYNFCEGQSNSTCELSNSSHILHEKDLVSKEKCTYFGSKDQCSSSLHCPLNAYCDGDSPGPSKCVCQKGFEGEKCEKDIDECIAGTHDCHVNATCNNTIGGFKCCWWQVIFDFENGSKTGWNLTGTAFNNQPTYGDNSKHRGKPSNLEGDWWIGGYEDCPNVSCTAGKIQGDGLTGTMTSTSFVIQGNQLRFLIGGGLKIKEIRAELLIGGEVVARETGSVNDETMATKYWYVDEYQGKTAQIRLVDNSTGSWGHINFDHLEGHFCSARVIVTMQ